MIEFLLNPPRTGQLTLIGKQGSGGTGFPVCHKGENYETYFTYGCQNCGLTAYISHILTFKQHIIIKIPASVFILVQNDAKNAFKELLASVNCSSDWSWEQALKLIVNDARWA